MYSEKIIIANLEAFASEYGWMPTYHTYQEVQEFSAYINSLTNIETNSKNAYLTVKKKITEKRAQEINHWIENEQILSSFDYHYWESRYAWVVDEKGNVYKFKNRVSQDVLDSIVAEFDEKQIAIQMLCGKGRQTGVTTKAALYFIHKVLHVPDTLAVMASVQKEKSDEIKVKLDTAYSRCPWWLVPRRTPKNSFSNRSRISIESGMQPKGIAQGKTPTAVHICLSLETLIHIQDGTIKPISEIVPGDKVFTSRNRQMKVNACVRSQRQNEVACELSLWGNYSPLIVTRDHKIFTPEGFVEAENIESKDFVVMPLRRISKTIKRTELVHIKRGSKKTQKLSDSHVKEVIKLNKDWGWLCGLYLAEGSLRQRKNDTGFVSTTFSVHQYEIASVQLKLSQALGMFQHIGIQKSKRSKSANMEIGSIGIANWFAENFGRGAENKTIPDWVFDAGHDFINGLICGYLEGDGHISKRTDQVTCTSISMSLIIQLRDLLAAMGYGWSCIYFQPSGRYYGRDCKDRWTLSINGDYGRKLRSCMQWETVGKKKGALPSGHPNYSSAPKHWKYSPDGKSVWIQVYENRPVLCESFYDLEVDAPEHDFCTIHCCVKNSEIGLIPDPKNVIEEGLLPAVHPSRNLFMIFEGTGSGNVGWFPDFWRDSKRNYPLGLARMRPVFIPWPMATDLYPQADWLKEHPVPEGFYENRMDATKRHVSRCEAYIRNTDYLAKVAGKDYRMPLSQQWFWQFEYRQAKERHTLQQHAARLPADDYEMLTGQHDQMYEVEQIEVLESNIYETVVNEKTGEVDRKRIKEPQAYAITGHDVIDEFNDVPDNSVDWEKPVILVEWDSYRGQHFEWELIPLLWLDEDDEKNTMDRLLVYGEPCKGFDYTCAVDTADGLGKPDEDRSCISVNQVHKGAECDLQMAEFTTNRLNSAQITAFAACIGAWYSSCAIDPRGIKYIVEQIEAPGDTCQHQLKMMGFNWHHDPQRYDARSLSPRRGSYQGFFSTRVSVPILDTRFDEAVKDGWYVPRSRWLIEELKTLERHERGSKPSKIEHRTGSHDDRVKAAAMSYFTAHDRDVLAERAQKRYNLPDKKPSDSKGICRANSFSIGNWKD